MPTYFYRIVGTGYRQANMEWIDLADDIAARRQALAQVRDLLTDAVAVEESEADFHIEVTDETGRPVTTLTLKKIAG